MSDAVNDEDILSKITPAELLEFRELAFTLHPVHLNVLRSAITDRDKGRTLEVCRSYLPKFKEDKAGRFLLWLAKQP